MLVGIWFGLYWVQYYMCFLSSIITFKVQSRVRYQNHDHMYGHWCTFTVFYHTIPYHAIRVRARARRTQGRNWNLQGS